MRQDQAAAIHEFWFAPGNEPLWFDPSEEFDEAIRSKFADLIGPACAGELDDMATTARGALALVIVLDQFPRNLYRGTPDAYRGDHHARTIARLAIARGADLERPMRERVFFYLPLGHSESLVDQEEAVRLAATLGNDVYLAHARSHRDVIASFGRFPHRNAVLGRTSTPEELAFLESGG